MNRRAAQLMHYPESNSPKSGQGGGWACWLLAVLVLGAFLPAVGFMILMAGLFVLCAAYRWAAVMLGLALAVGSTISMIAIMSDPKMGDMAPTGLLFIPWAGFGLWLAAKGISKKRE